MHIIQVFYISLPVYHSVVDDQVFDAATEVFLSVNGCLWPCIGCNDNTIDAHGLGVLELSQHSVSAAPKVKHAYRDIHRCRARSPS